MISLFGFCRNPAARRGFVLLCGSMLAGCGRNDIQVYRVAKEQPQQPTQAAAMPSKGQDGFGTPPGLKYKVPANWQETAPGEMRAASFHVQDKVGKQADISVVPLPGLMGGDLEIVNRWRSTVGLAPVKEEELPKLAQPVEIGRQTGQLYEQAGENPGSGDKSRILAAVLRRESVAWFFKMNGDDQVVSEQKPAFLEFLKSVNFVSGPIRTDLPPSHPPIGDLNAMPMASGASGSATEGKPSWQVPESWKEISGGPFLVAKFVIAGADNAQAAVNVSMSAGEGGGLAMNVNRWRGQLGLNPLSEAELNKLVTSLDTTVGKAMMVDMAGVDARTNQKSRLIGAMVTQGSRTWFYKLMGNEGLVEREKEAFSKFIQTAKYPNAA